MVKPAGGEASTEVENAWIVDSCVVSLFFISWFGGD
jgi:hypothetical protein